jgi:hypothetical protein
MSHNSYAQQHTLATAIVSNYINTSAKQSKAKQSKAKQSKAKQSKAKQRSGKKEKS